MIQWDSCVIKDKFTAGHIIFVGDYNYPMIDWETGTRPQAAHLKTLIFYFLKQLETVS